MTHRKNTRDLMQLNLQGTSVIDEGTPQYTATTNHDRVFITRGAYRSSNSWTDSQLVRFLGDISSLSQRDTVLLLQKDTAQSTHLLRASLMLCHHPAYDILMRADTIQKLVYAVLEVDHELMATPLEMEKRKHLHELIVDLLDWSVVQQHKDRPTIPTELWKYGILALKGLAKVYRAEGALEQARYMLEKAIQYEGQNPQSLEQVVSVTATFNALALVCIDMKDYTAAHCHYRRLLRLQKDALDVDHPLVIASLQSMAQLYLRCQQYNDCLSIFHHVLILQDSRYGATNLLETASTLSSMGLLYYILKDYTNALHNYHEGLTMLLRHYGGDDDNSGGSGHHHHVQSNHFDIAMTLNSIGMIHCEVGNYEKARQTLQKCLSMHLALGGQRAGLGSDNNHEQEQDTVLLDPEAARLNESAISAVLYNLAVVYLQKGEDEIAHGLFCKSIQFKKAVFGNGNAAAYPADMARNLQRLGNIHLDRGEHHVAILYLEEALGALQNTAPGSSSNGHDALTTTLCNQLMLLGNLHLGLGYVREMMSCMVRACRITNGRNTAVQALMQAPHASTLAAYSVNRIHPPCSPAA